MKSHGFDVEVVYDGETIRAVGTIDPGESATGPTYDCGGTPGEPARVDEVRFFTEGVEIADDDGEILAAVEDEIMEQASEEAEADAQDAAEARADARRDRD